MINLDNDISKTNKKKNTSQASAESYDGFPESSFDLVNKYGTYEIQPTCEMQSEWPEIAQGIPKNYKKPTVKNKTNNYGKDLKPKDANKK